MPSRQHEQWKDALLALLLFAYSTVEGDDGHLASGRYVGSAPGPGDQPPLHGHAIQAQSCTWSGERAHEALDRQ